MPADEHGACFSLYTYTDPVYAVPCAEQVVKAVYTASYGDCHCGRLAVSSIDFAIAGIFHCLWNCFRGS